MSHMPTQFENCIVLLMGFPGAGKRTVGDALALKMGARFSDHHDLVDPILKLWGDDYNVMWDMTPAMWDKFNAVHDVYLSTIADACSKDSSFIITEMMFDQDPFHKIFYDKVLSVVQKRQAHFFPIRLVCDEDELAKRVQSDGRKQYFKTRDVELSRRRSKENEVFYSHHANELTINNTHLSPDDVSELIIKHIKSKM